jgi:hypothetical protein
MRNKIHGVASEKALWVYEVRVLETKLPETSSHLVKEAAQLLVIGGIHITTFYVE